MEEEEEVVVVVVERGPKAVTPLIKPDGYGFVCDIHVAPPSVDVFSDPPTTQAAEVPTKAMLLATPVVTELQVAPLSVERRTPEI